MKEYLNPLNKLGLGTAAIAQGGDKSGYHLGGITENEANTLLSYLYERGIYLWDCAPVYGLGSSEQRIGSFFKSKGSEARQKVFLVSKGGVGWHSSGRINMSNTPAHIDQQLHESLKTLQTEYIDLYMIHWPDPLVDIRRNIEQLARYQEQSKIRFIGLSNTNIQDFKRSEEVCKIDALQFEANYFTYQNYPWIEKLKKERPELLTIAWGLFDKGLLSGRWKTNTSFAKGDYRSLPLFKKDPERVKRHQKVEEFFKLYQNKNDKLTKAQMCVDFNKSLPFVDISLCGSKTIADWNEVLTLK